MLIWTYVLGLKYDTSRFCIDEVQLLQKRIKFKLTRARFLKRNSNNPVVILNSCYENVASSKLFFVVTYQFFSFNWWTEESIYVCWFLHCPSLTWKSFKSSSLREWMFCFDAAKKKIVAVIAYLKLKLLLMKGRGESWNQILNLLWYYDEVCDHLI